MADAAQEVHTSYGCDASSATGTTQVVTAFKQYFGYSDAFYGAYNVNDVASNLYFNRPVMLGGYTSNFLWWGTGDAHEWVCDGYQKYYDEGNEYCTYDDYGNESCYTPTTVQYYLHMNWGWGGGHNGWFSSTYFGADINGNPMNHNFQCNLDEVVNIHP